MVGKDFDPLKAIHEVVVSVVDGGAIRLNKNVDIGAHPLMIGGTTSGGDGEFYLVGHRGARGTNIEFPPIDEEVRRPLETFYTLGKCSVVGIDTSKVTSCSC